jgi:predicted secreted protein
MTIGTAISVYVIFWWVLLFAFLPIGVKAQDETGRVRKGSAESAPVKQHLVLKMLATTVVSAVIFAAVYYLVANHILTLNSIPFLPRFQPLR